MSEQGATRQFDSILLPFLHEADEDESKNLLEQIVLNHADYVIKAVISSEMQVSLDRAGRQDWNNHHVMDARDAYSEIVEKLVKRLQDLKSDSGGEPITNFRTYVGSMAKNACYNYLRQKYPQRCKFKYRLRYLLTHREEFALWGSETEELLCGLASWERINRAVGWGDIQNRVAISASEAVSMDLAELLTAIFKQFGVPMKFEDLVTLTADLLDLKDQVDSTTCFQEQGRSDIAERIEQQSYLKRLWEEICELPLRQRIALLLNLRDEGGYGIALFIHIGLTSIRNIAELLGMPADQFAVLWNDLPIDDAQIAERFGITRQQVVNFRSKARIRLAQKMKGL